MENINLIALSRLNVLRNQMATVANNMANADTDGFKTENIMFDDYVVKTRGDEASLKTKIAFVSDVASYRDLSKGALISTGNDLDLAIAGEGYFVIEGPDGNRFTANGKFSTNESGELIASNGAKVLDVDNQPITIDPAATNIDISRQGTVSVDGAEVTKLQVVRFDNPQMLERVANGVYRAPDNVAPEVMDDPDITQGSIEESNVQPIIQMTEMIRIHRAYESTSRMMSQDHDRQRKAIDILTRTN
jgi:flagellar basal-body rod protein FlgF